MKKAVVVGGSSGIGLGIAKELIRNSHFVTIVDRNKVPENELNINDYEYIYCDLTNFNDDTFERLASDESVDTLMITAGFGRAANFEFLHSIEIEQLMTVNATSAIRVIRNFYERISGVKPFYCGVVASIAGLLSSPLFSVYSASKAALCRFIESVNIELEVKGTGNRILNVSPSSIPGTKFNGGPNDPSQVEVLAKKITEELYKQTELYIPKYDETFKAVLERYHNDPHEYGLHSYNYKIESGRVFNEKRVKIGYLSGTFDLFHVGHLNLLKRAKESCDYLIVGVHPSAAHKGKETFISFEERKQIVEACKYVDKVVPSTPEDSDAWSLYHYDKLFVGSDYKGTERFNRYEEYFKDKGVEIVYFPYTQGTSSTQIRKTVLMKTKDI